MTTTHKLKHPIAVFVLALLVVIGLGVGVLAATIGSSQPRSYVVEGFLRAVGGPPPGCRQNRLHKRVCWPGYRRLTGTIRFVSTSSPGTVYYTHADDGRWTARLPPGTYNVSGLSNGVFVGSTSRNRNHVYWTVPNQVAVADVTVRNVYVAYQIR